MKKGLVAVLALAAVALVAIVVVSRSSPKEREDSIPPSEARAARGYAPTSGVVERAPHDRRMVGVSAEAKPSLRSKSLGQCDPRSPRVAPTATVSERIPRAKAALIALFATRPGEMPPELPELTHEERNLLPMVIENELTDADGCDAEAIRRAFHQYMESGGIHSDFLQDYRKRLVRSAAK